jgi:hypothetical protein
VEILQTERKVRAVVERGGCADVGKYKYSNYIQPTTSQLLNPFHHRSGTKVYSKYDEKGNLWIKVDGIFRGTPTSCASVWKVRRREGKTEKGHK